MKVLKKKILFKNYLGIQFNKKKDKENFLN
jgi:hypothetical protein